MDGENDTSTPKIANDTKQHRNRGKINSNKLFCSFDLIRAFVPVYILLLSFEIWLLTQLYRQCLYKWRFIARKIIYRPFSMAFSMAITTPRHMSKGPCSLPLPPPLSAPSARYPPRRPPPRRPRQPRSKRRRTGTVPGEAPVTRHPRRSPGQSWISRPF